MDVEAEHGMETFCAVPAAKEAKFSALDYNCKMVVANFLTFWELSRLVVLSKEFAVDRKRLARIMLLKFQQEHMALWQRIQDCGRIVMEDPIVIPPCRKDGIVENLTSVKASHELIQSRNDRCMKGVHWIEMPPTKRQLLWRLEVETVLTAQAKVWAIGERQPFVPEDVPNIWPSPKLLQPPEDLPPDIYKNRRLCNNALIAKIIGQLALNQTRQYCHNFRHGGRHYITIHEVAKEICLLGGVDEFTQHTLTLWELFANGAQAGLKA